MTFPVAPPVPRSILVARRCATVQAAACLLIAVIAAGYGVLAYSSDLSAAAHGQANEWAGLGEVVAVVVGGLALAAALLLGVPAALLRRGGRLARTVLIIAEVITGFPVARFAAPAVLAGNLSPVTLAAIGYLGLAAIVLSSLAGPRT